MLPSLEEVSEVAGAQRRSSFTVGAKGFFEKGCRASFESSSYLYLDPFDAKRHAFPSDTGRCGK